MLRIALAALALISATGGHAKRDPFDCSGVERYPFNIAIGELRNRGELDQSDVDFTRSTSEVIATRQIKRDLQRQVLLLKIRTKSKKTIEAMVINYASREECSMGGAKIYKITELHP